MVCGSADFLWGEGSFEPGNGTHRTVQKCPNVKRIIDGAAETDAGLSMCVCIYIYIYMVASPPPRSTPSFGHS